MNESRIRQRSTQDDALMESIAHGDGDAFRLLLCRHRRWVYRLLYAWVRDSDQAEDLTQEAFARVYRYAYRYDSQGQFTHWLRRLTVNLARSFLQRQKQMAMVRLDELEEEPSGDTGDDPAAILSTRGLHEEMRAAIESLPEAQRQVLLLRYFSDMSVRAIAEALECAEGTIQSRLFYGLRRVREILASKDAEEKKEGKQHD